MTCRLAIIALLLLTVSPAAAQENSVGVTYAPSLSLHDDDEPFGCCMAAGPWLQIGRLYVEYIAAWDYHWRENRAAYREYFTAPDAKVDGHLLTILGTVKTWRPAEQFRVRLQAGVRHGTAIEPTPWTTGGGADLTVDYLTEAAVLRGSFRMLWPKAPEFRIGLGFRF